MSRKRRRFAQVRGGRRRSFLDGWTLQRATGAGILAGLLAFVLVAIVGIGSELRLQAYAGLLLVTAACGASILWITAVDMRARGTRGRMRAIRGFDLAIGLALLVPSLYAFNRVIPELGL